jgi:hypothetical protein
MLNGTMGTGSVEFMFDRLQLSVFQQKDLMLKN